MGQPNDLLADIRHLANVVAGEQGSTQLVANAADTLARKVQELDRWISSGELPPLDWRQAQRVEQRGTVYVVHEHEPSEGSTILYVGTDLTEAQKVCATAVGTNTRRGLRYQDIDIAELELNCVPEERDITLKVSKRELQEMIEALDKEGNVKLSDHLRGSNES